MLYHFLGFNYPFQAASTAASATNYWHSGRTVRCKSGQRCSWARVWRLLTFMMKLQAT